VGQKSVIR